MIKQRNKQNFVPFLICKFGTYSYDAINKGAYFLPGKCIMVSSILPNIPINF